MEQYLIEKKSWYKTPWFYIVLLGLICILGMLLFRTHNSIPTQYATPFIVKSKLQNKTIQALGKIEVRAPHVISTQDSGLIIKLHVRQGQLVARGDVLAHITNHQLEQQYQAGLSELVTLKSDIALQTSNLQRDKYNLESQLARAMAIESNQQLELEAYEKLVQSGVVSTIKYQQAKTLLQQYQTEVKLLKKQSSAFAENYLMHRAALKAKIDAKQNQLNYMLARIDALTVKADVDGIVSHINAHIGERINAGEVLFKLVEPSQLIAKISVPQYSSDELELGQAAVIHTPKGAIHASVEYIDTVIRQGSVHVYLAPTKQMPDWLRIDQSVEASFVSQRQHTQLFIEKPSYFSDYAQWQVYKVGQQGHGAQQLNAQMTVREVIQLASSPDIRTGDKLLLLPVELANTEHVSL